MSIALCLPGAQAEAPKSHENANQVQPRNNQVKWSFFELRDLPPILLATRSPTNPFPVSGTKYAMIIPQHLRPAKCLQKLVQGNKAVRLPSPAKETHVGICQPHVGSFFFKRRSLTLASTHGKDGRAPPCGRSPGPHPAQSATPAIAKELVEQRPVGHARVAAHRTFSPRAYPEGKIGSFVGSGFDPGQGFVRT